MKEKNMVSQFLKNNFKNITARRAPLPDDEPNYMKTSNFGQGNFPPPSNGVGFNNWEDDSSKNSLKLAIPREDKNYEDDIKENSSIEFKELPSLPIIRSNKILQRSIYNYSDNIRYYIDNNVNDIIPLSVQVNPMNSSILRGFRDRYYYKTSKYNSLSNCLYITNDIPVGQYYDFWINSIILSSYSQILYRNLGMAVRRGLDNYTNRRVEQQINQQINQRMINAFRARVDAQVRREVEQLIQINNFIPQNPNPNALQMNRPFWDDGNEEPFRVDPYSPPNSISTPSLGGLSRRNSLDSNNNNDYANSSRASLDLNNSEGDFNNGGDLRGGYSYSYPYYPEEIYKIVDFILTFFKIYKDIFTKSSLNEKFENQNEACSVVTTPLPRYTYSILPAKSTEIYAPRNGTCFIWGIFGFIFIKVILGFIFKKKTID